MEKVFAATSSVITARAFLDMAAEYIQSGSLTEDTSDKLETVLCAILAARDNAKAAEEALLNATP